MTTVGQTGLDTKRLVLAAEVRHRARFHFMRDLSTVDLDRDFTQVHLRGNLLVQQNGEHKAPLITNNRSEAELVEANQLPEKKRADFVL
jgi:hypothetical protein